MDIDDRLREHRLNWPETFDPDGMGLAFALYGARDAAVAKARAVWEDHGLTAAGFDVLATLRRAPPPREMTPGRIQASLLITSGGLTKVLAQLAALGLVSRNAGSGDQRVKPVRLTGRGARVIEAAMARLVAETGEWMCSALSRGEQRALTALLRRLADAPGPTAP
ncbi:MAG: MarR family transcriptional regulator [Rhodocyclaceae bacterium]|nr:MarR family transcriptional regulator [Rhodocyclaceae bacterium]